MRTLLITGSDTGIGKTRVTGLLAALLPEPGQTVRIVKPVETGVAPDARGDADNAAAFAREAARAIHVEAYTLRRFLDPLAPVAAAARAGETLDPERLLSEIDRLPGCDWRLIEGAGGLAVPLDRSGRDWSDFAAALPGVHVVLVVPDRLGAINQARLTAHYARSKGLDCSLWLNETVSADRAVRDANREGVSGDKSLPLFRLGFQANVPEDGERVAAFYRALPRTETALAGGRRQPATKL